MSKCSIKIVIIDDNETRRNQIKSFLPSYMDVIALNYGDAAQAALLPDEDGDIPNLVILNGDDVRGKGLYTFDWMVTKSHNNDVVDIPVIVLTEDEFSDRSLDFLEIGDVIFYEGEIEEGSIFELVTETIADNEFELEPVEPAYTGEKSYDKVLGLKIKPAGNGAKKRSVALNMESQLLNLEAAIERGRQKTALIKELLGAAVDLKEERKEKRESAPRFLNKVRVDNGYEPIEDDVSLNEYYKKMLLDMKEESNRKSGKKIESYVDPLLDGLDEIDDHDFGKSRSYEGEVDPLLAGLDDIDDGESVKVYDSALKQTVKSDILNPMKGFGDRIMANAMDAINAHSVRVKEEANKHTIVVVDDSEEDRNSCEICLSAKYNVILLESGQEAIGYFTNNTADMILMDTYMPGLGGVQTLDQIRSMENGKGIPVVYMVDKRYPVYAENLAGDRIIGVLQKPIKMIGLAMAVDGYFRSRR